MSKKPVPSKKQSRSSSRSRHTTYVKKQQDRLEKLVALEDCPETGEKKLRHFASPSGKYRGKQIFEKSSPSAPIQEIKA